MWLKRLTPQNIVIGGAAGALPPVIGWAVVTNAISIEPLVLFLLVFLWTPPHFWALSLYRSDDYAKAGVPMLPVVSGAATTKLQILVYSVVLTLVAAIVPPVMGFATPRLRRRSSHCWARCSSISPGRFTACRRRTPR